MVVSAVLLVLSGLVGLACMVVSLSVVVTAGNARSPIMRGAAVACAVVRRQFVGVRSRGVVGMRTGVGRFEDVRRHAYGGCQRHSVVCRQCICRQGGASRCSGDSSRKDCVDKRIPLYGKISSVTIKHYTIPLVPSPNTSLGAHSFISKYLRMMESGPLR